MIKSQRKLTIKDVWSNLLLLPYVKRNVASRPATDLTEWDLKGSREKSHRYDRICEYPKLKSLLLVSVNRCHKAHRLSTASTKAAERTLAIGRSAAERR